MPRPEETSLHALRRPDGRPSAGVISSARGGAGAVGLRHRRRPRRLRRRGGHPRPSGARRRHDRPRRADRRPGRWGGARARGGTVKILLWQAPTVVNIHFSSGTKDDIVTRVVYEPLATLDNDGKFVPLLASTIPSKENGLLAADGKGVTWKLKEGIKWSDGAPFSADDVVFTWQYATDKETAASTVGQFTSIDKVEKVDP